MGDIEPKEFEGTLYCFDFDKTLTNNHMHLFLQGYDYIERRETEKILPKVGDRDEAVQGVQVIGEDGAFYKEIEGVKTAVRSLNPDCPAGWKVLSEEALQAKAKAEIENSGTKNGIQIAHAMAYALDHGDYVAITSYSLYPEIIKPALHDMFIAAGYDPSRYLDKICVVGGHPSNGTDNNSPNFKGKEEHIAAVQQYFGAKYNVEIPRDNVMLIDDDQANLDVAVKKAPYSLIVKVPEEQNPQDFTYIAQLYHFDDAETRSVTSQLDRLQSKLDEFFPGTYKSIPTGINVKLTGDIKGIDVIYAALGYRMKNIEGLLQAFDEINENMTVYIVDEILEMDLEKRPNGIQEIIDAAKNEFSLESSDDDDGMGVEEESSRESHRSSSPTELQQPSQSRRHSPMPQRDLLGSRGYTAETNEERIQRLHKERDRDRSPPPGSLRPGTPADKKK